MAYIDSTKRAGWDDLYEDCFNKINQIIEDNQQHKHDGELINIVFPRMLLALKEAIERMNNLPGSAERKGPWFEKVSRIKDFLNTCDSINKKVIGINMVDQFLRASY